MSFAATQNNFADIYFIYFYAEKQQLNFDPKTRPQD